MIPARFASSRFPGKPLELLRGSTGKAKSLVQRTWEAASAARGVDRVVVASDDIRIRDTVEEFNGECIMTSPACRNGTERCAEVLGLFGNAFEIVVNVQGDAPLTAPWFIEDIVDALYENEAFGIATPVIRCDGSSLNGFMADRNSGRVGGTTVVFDREGRALYFSKEVIPWTGLSFDPEEPTPVFHHVGLYAYTASSLAGYPRLRPGYLEELEGLEQLRFLENGESILCVEVDPRGRVFWEVNNPEDIAKVEQMLVKEAIV